MPGDLRQYDREEPSGRPDALSGMPIHERMATSERYVRFLCCAERYC